MGVKSFENKVGDSETQSRCQEDAGSHTFTVVGSDGKGGVGEEGAVRRASAYHQDTHPLKEPGGAEQTEAVSWQQFTENTTFHGIRYIFNSSLRVRKLLWIMCVLGAISAFMVHVSIRTFDYFKYATTIDVKLVHAEHLSFPAVTFCNQNNFRTTVMSDNHWYEFINTVYNTNADVELDLMYDGVNDTNAHEFITASAHQLADLIDQCSWNQRECNLEEDFIQTITEIGVCYTYMPKEKVGKAGSRYGLRLILNVEQYEYMRGPNNDAGVKIMLHERDESPLMSNYGFSVMPGEHTSVAIRLEQESALPKPYGECNADVTQADRSRCLAQCELVATARRCQCVDVYMDNHTHPTCDVQSLFHCARNGSAVEDTAPACTCDIACTQTTYEISLSYAQLSQFNIQRLALNNETRRQHVQQTFGKAREASQRVDPDIHDFDSRRLNQLDRLFDVLLEIMNNTLHTFSSETNFQSAYELPLPLTSGSRLLDGDKTHAHTTLEHVDSLINSFSLALQNTWQGNDFLPHVTRIYASTICAFCRDVLISQDPGDSELVDRLARCDSILNNSISYFWSPVDFSRDQEYFSYCSDGLTDCFYRQATELSWVCSNALSMARLKLHGNGTGLDRNSVQTIFNTYLSSRDTHMEIMSMLGITNYYDVECNKYLYDASHSTYTVNQVLDMFENYMYTYSVGEHSNIAGVIFDTLNDDFIKSYSNYPIDDPFEACNWFYDLEDNPEIFHCFECEERTKLFSDIEAASDKYAALGYGVIDAARSLTTAYTTMHRVGPLVRRAVEQYQNQEITKHNLGEIMDSISSRQALGLVGMEGTNFISTALQLVQDASGITENLNDIYHNRFVLAFPLYNTSSFPFTHYLTYINEHDTNGDTDIGHRLASISRRTPASISQGLSEIFEIMFERYINITENATAHLSENLENLLNAQEDYQKRLDEFIQSGQMDNEFFLKNILQVDLFYKELSYNKIEQQPLFSYSSLLSEVGGFLGLLLGASILTVCEVLDYICMKLFASFYTTR